MSNHINVAGGLAVIIGDNVETSDVPIDGKHISIIDKHTPRGENHIQSDGENHIQSDGENHIHYDNPEQWQEDIKKHEKRVKEDLDFLNSGDTGE